MTSFIEAKTKYPELMNELLTLEYVLTWRYTDDEKRDDLRYKEIQTIIYEGTI